MKACLTNDHLRGGVYVAAHLGTKSRQRVTYVNRHRESVDWEFLVSALEVVTILMSWS